MCQTDRPMLLDDPVSFDGQFATWSTQRLTANTAATREPREHRRSPGPDVGPKKKTPPTAKLLPHSSPDSNRQTVRVRSNTNLLHCPGPTLGSSEASASFGKQLNCRYPLLLVKASIWSSASAPEAESFQLPQIANGPFVRGPSGGADGLHQRPAIPCSLPSLLRWLLAQKHTGLMVSGKSCSSVGCLHYIGFQSTEVENKVLPKEKKRTQCQNLSVGDELRLGWRVSLELSALAPRLAHGQ